MVTFAPALISQQASNRDDCKSSPAEADSTSQARQLLEDFSLKNSGRSLAILHLDHDLTDAPRNSVMAPSNREVRELLARVLAPQEAALVARHFELTEDHRSQPSASADDDARIAGALRALRTPKKD